MSQLTFRNEQLSLSEHFFRQKDSQQSDHQIWNTINLTNIKFVWFWNVLRDTFEVNLQHGLLRWNHVKCENEEKSYMINRKNWLTGATRPTSNFSGGPVLWCDESSKNQQVPQVHSDHRELADPSDVQSLSFSRCRRSIQKSSSGVSGHNGEELILVYWKRKKKQKYIYQWGECP